MKLRGLLFTAYGWFLVAEAAAGRVSLTDPVIIVGFWVCGGAAVIRTAMLAGSLIDRITGASSKAGPPAPTDGAR